MAKLVKIDFDNDHHKTLKAPDSFKVHDTLIDANSPGSWLIVPTDSGGFFCTRAQLVTSIAVEDEGAAGSPS